MKSIVLLLAGFFILSIPSFAQSNHMTGGDNILSFVYEDFEGELFPPPGWILEYTGPLYWKHTNLASGYSIGTASALYENFSAPTGITQSLVLTSLGPTITGDSLSFDHAYATYTSEVDKLVIETSNDGEQLIVHLLRLMAA